MALNATSRKARPMTPTKPPTAEAPPEADANSPQNELDEAPFDDGDSRMTGTDISAYIAQGYEGVALGSVLPDATESLPEIIDQEDLDGVPFAVLDVREQDKMTEIKGERVTEYVMVIAAVQPLELGPEGQVIETGAIFIMVAGRDESVLGREFRALVGVATPTKPVLFPRGIRRVDTGGGYRYYTTRPAQDKRDRPVLFPKRASK